MTRWMTFPALTLFLLMINVSASNAQQTQVTSKPRQTPTLTTGDVISVQPPAPVREDKSAQAGAPAFTAEKKSAGKQSADDKIRAAAEGNWNEQLRKAREKVRLLEREADQSELEITRQRNLQFSAQAKDAGTGTWINARVAQLSQDVSSLRAEAKAARSEVDALVKEGEAEKYQEAALSPKTADGAPNPEYYHSRQAELMTDLSDAESHIQVLQLRINDLSSRIRKNTGGVDEKGKATNSSDAFAIRRLKTALQEEQKNLAEAQDKKAEAARKIEALRQQSATAGVDPGEVR